MILGSALVTNILARARDPQGIATPRATALSLASTAQQVVNGAVGDVVTSSTLTLQPRTLIYPMSVFLPDALQVEAVRDSSGRDLGLLSGGYEELAWISNRWVQDVSDSPRSWCQIGGDLLVIYPGVRTRQTVTPFYTQITPTLVTEADSTVVANETDYAVEMLTEALINLKSRDYKAGEDAITRWSATITELRKEYR